MSCPSLSNFDHVVGRKGLAVAERGVHFVSGGPRRLPTGEGFVVFPNDEVRGRTRPLLLLPAFPFSPHRAQNGIPLRPVCRTRWPPGHSTSFTWVTGAVLDCMGRAARCTALPRFLLFPSELYLICRLWCALLSGTVCSFFAWFRTIIWAKPGTSKCSSPLTMI